MDKLLFSVCTSLFFKAEGSTVFELVYDLKFAVLFVVLSLVFSRYNMLSAKKELATVKTRFENIQDTVATLCFSFGAVIALEVFLKIGFISSFTSIEVNTLTTKQIVKVFFFCLVYSFCVTAIRNTGVLKTLKPIFVFIMSLGKLARKSK